MRGNLPKWLASKRNWSPTRQLKAVAWWKSDKSGNGNFNEELFNRLIQVRERANV